MQDFWKSIFVSLVSLRFCLEKRSLILYLSWIKEKKVFCFFKKFFLILFIFPSICFTSQDWTEYLINGFKEDIFFKVREEYINLNSRGKSIENDFYSPREYKIGDEGYSFYTNSYESEQELEIPTYDLNHPNESEETCPDVSYVQPPVQGNQDWNTEEKILSCGGTTDKRKEIKNVNEWPFRATCLLKFRDGSQEYMGTGFFVGPYHILTAAHNYWDWKKGAAMKDFFCFPLHHVEKGMNIPTKTLLNKNPYSAEVWKVYMRKGYSQSSKNIEDDLALFILDKPVGLEIGWESIAAIDKNFLKNIPMTTHGYPRDSVAERDFKRRGRMYGMDGQIVDVGDSDSLLYHNMDTTGGQSGSGIWIRNEENSFMSLKKSCVGVHTGPGRFGRSENRAVILKREDVEFISNTIRSHVNPSMVFDYLSGCNGTLSQLKIGSFIKDSEIEGKIESYSLNIEEAKKGFPLIKKFVLLNVLFDRDIKNCSENIQLKFNRCLGNNFINAVKKLKIDVNDESHLDSYKNLSESIFFILMRKKIFKEEKASKSISSFGPFSSPQKTTDFFDDIKKRINKKPNEGISLLKKLDKEDRTKILKLTGVRVQEIVHKTLVLDEVEGIPPLEIKENLYQKFEIDNNLLSELVLLMKTIDLCFGWRDIVLYPDHSDSFSQENLSFLKKRGLNYLNNIEL